MYSFKQRERGSFLNTKQNDCSFISLPGKRLSLLSVTFPFVCCSFFTTNLCGCFEKLVIYFFILNRRANINQYSPKDATYFSLVLNKCIAGAPSFAEDMFSDCVLLCLSLSLIVFLLLVGKIDIDCAFALETKQPFTLHMQVPQLATMWIHTKILTLNQ